MDAVLYFTGNGIIFFKMKKESTLLLFIYHNADSANLGTIIVLM